MFILLTWLITIIYGKFSPCGAHTIPNIKWNNNYAPSTHLTNKQNQALPLHHPLNQNERQFNTTTIGVAVLSSKTANDTIYHIITQSQTAWPTTQSTDDTNVYDDDDDDD
eukprot:3053_1